MTASRDRRFNIVAAVLVVAAAALMLLPVEATYLNDVGSDTIEYRTATCGPPVMSLLGATPGLGGGSAERIGGEMSRTACDAASAKRAMGGLALLLGASLTWGFGQRRRAGE